MKKCLSVALAALLLVVLFTACAKTPAETGGNGDAPDMENSAAPSGKPERPGNTAIAEYSYQYTNMRLELPEDWEYEILPGTGDVAFGADDRPADTFGIQFWPKAEPSMSVNLRYYAGGIGLCGTGVTFEELSFKNGLTATKCTEGLGDDFWVFLIYHDVPGAYALECITSKELWSAYENIVMSILENAELGRGILSETEAIEIAKTEYTGSYESVRADFDHTEGAWQIRFSTNDMTGQEQTIRIDAQRTVYA